MECFSKRDLSASVREYRGGCLMHFSPIQVANLVQKYLICLTKQAFSVSIMKVLKMPIYQSKISKKITTPTFKSHTRVNSYNKVWLQNSFQIWFIFVIQSLPSRIMKANFLLLLSKFLFLNVFFKFVTYSPRKARHCS